MDARECDLEIVLVGMGVRDPAIITFTTAAIQRIKSKNLGALLTIWDRLFGTYYNPDDVTGELKFGRANVNPVRLVIGV